LRYNRQRDWLEWLVTAEFAVNNKIYIATKVLPFMANYGRELWMGVDIRRKVSELKMMNLVSILFYFIFLLFSLILYG